MPPSSSGAGSGPPPPPTGAVSAPSPLRELLFADLPPAQARPVFVRGGVSTAYLVALADAAASRDTAGALAALAGAPAADRETRLHLQAWSLAREAGADPAAANPAAAREVLGVVVDMGLDAGLDTLAAYADGSARYLNHSGSAVVWEVPDMAVGQLVRALLNEAAIVVTMGAPLDGPRFPPPAPGATMISVLTRGGIYLGTGPIDAITADPRGGPVISAASELLALLVQRSQQANPAAG